MWLDLTVARRRRLVDVALGKTLSALPPTASVSRRRRLRHAVISTPACLPTPPLPPHPCLIAELFGYEQFAAAFSVVLAHAQYLPSAQMFALLPLASLMGRTGNGNGSIVDYDEASKRVVVTAQRPYRSAPGTGSWCSAEADRKSGLGRPASRSIPVQPSPCPLGQGGPGGAAERRAPQRRAADGHWQPPRVQHVGLH